MDETTREYHEVSMIFPMMCEDEYQSLKQDISENGLIEPIWIDAEGKIIDGRNRHKACIETNTPMSFRTYSGSQSLTSFVVSLNLKRRHLNETQRAGVAAKIANMRVGDNQHKTGTPNLESLPVSIPQAAEMLNVGKSTVATYRAVAVAAPELVEKMDAGEMTAHEAYKKVKENKRAELIEKQVEQIETNSYKPPTGLYDVIVIDPPWPYGTKYDPDGRRAANPYPEMSLEDISAINIPASENSILWLWTTHKFMRYSFDLIDGWGFRDVAIVTWVKNRMGLGSWLRSQSEFCIMAVKGKPVINLSNQTTIIHGDMREHSRKPDEFYDMVNSLCVGYKIDWFSREKREGWSQYGNDVEKF